MSLLPAQAAITFGKWRDINPANYSEAVAGDLHGIYVRNGGSGSIGAGDGWAVGGGAGGSGCGSPPCSIISHYDGFSWQIVASPVADPVSYNSAHFCTSPGAPGVGLCSPNGDGSDGWIVGCISPCTAGGEGVSLYWDGAALTRITLGLATTAANLTSVFMVCHSPPFGTGCPGGGAFTGGLTFAVGSNSSGKGAIYQFSGNPKSGGGWTQQTVTSLDGVPTPTFNSVYMFQDNTGTLEGFAVGGNVANGGVVARLNGGSWTQMKLNPSASPLKAVFVDSGNPIDAWAAGNGGQIWHFSTGFWSGPVSPGATLNDLTSIFLVSTSEGWMVGTHSTILHSTTLGSSNTWTALSSVLNTATGSGINLLSVSFPSGGNGWAVGSQGVILQTSNSNCGSIVPSPCWGGSTSIVQSTILNSVFEVGSSDAWAGGTFDTISNQFSLIHWDGIKWHRANVSPLSVTTPDIWGIFMLGSGEGWAMGGSATKPEALLWNGNTWNGQPIANCGAGAEPLSVFMISGGTSGDGWAVGTGGCIWRHQSGSWTTVTSPTTNDLNSVFIQNPGASGGTPAGFAVGKTGTVVELTITGGVPTWSSITPSGIVAQNLYGVYFKDTNHGWIVGDSSTIVSTIDGGSTWSGGIGQVIGAPLATNLTSVFVDTYGVGSGNGDGWAVGDDGSMNVIFAHWDGSFWTNTPLAPPIATSPTGLRLHSVFLTGPEDGFAVGRPVNGGTLSGIMHLDPLYPPTSGGGGGTTYTPPATTTASSTSTTTVSSTSTSAGSTSTSVTTSSSTSASTATAASTPVATFTVTSSSTTTTAASTSQSSSVSTPLALPPIPGFPWESIIAGIILGMTALAILRRRRK